MTQTIPLPAGGAGWLVLALGADVELELEGFVADAEFEDEDELAGAAAPELELVAFDVFADPPEALALSVDLDDLDFRLLVAFVLEPVPEEVSAEAELEEEALDDLDFFELVDLVPAAESDDAVESAFASAEVDFADFDFLELVDFVPDAESAEAESLELDFADLAFLEPLVELLAESLLEELAFFDFEVPDSPEDEVSVASEDVEAADFFFLVDFLVLVELVSLESGDCDCALAGAALMSAKASPAETRNAKTYFLSSFMLVPPHFFA